MPYVSVDGVKLYYEETGEGFPLVLAHEFAGDHRSWDAQVKYFARRYRVITYAARGYLPSDVPERVEDYSQEQAAEDLYAVLRHLDIERAYIGGLSMGGTTALQFGINHPEMARALIVAAAGSGSVNPEQFHKDTDATAQRFEAEGMETMAEEYASGPTRLSFKRKDPKGWAELRDMLAQHSTRGSVLTFRGVQMRRPPVFELAPQLQELAMPVLIIIGDEDEPCVEPGVFMKRNIPSSGLAVFPQTGHTLNLEEPDLFNRTVLDFLTTVEAGRWAKREVPVQPVGASGRP